jgi:hypothetical protein
MSQIQDRIANLVHRVEHVVAEQLEDIAMKREGTISVVG